jgi:exodeoxyribonuclease V beta subunit
VSGFDVLASPLRRDGADAVPSPLLVEASAGSGKTWTLAHLAVRFMVEDHVEPDRILLVTFTRDAARELRGRVREHLDTVIAFLVAPADDAGAAQEWRDAWARRWEGGATREDDLRRARLCRANLDGLHARTIHSFAAATTRGEAAGVGDDGRLWRQALAETRARWALRRPGDDAALRSRDPATIEEIARVLYESGVRSAAGGPAVDVVPHRGDARGDATSHAAHLQRELALDVVARFSALLRRAHRSSFADLVVGLAERLERTDAGRFVEDLRNAYSVVMIDEFQDTDPLQWRVFSEIFLDAPQCRLIAVGDPKQAIYRFRSASVETFLGVRDACRARGVPVVSLAHNYRATPRMVGAVNALFAGTDFHYAPDEPAESPVIAFEAATSRRAAAAHPATAFGDRDAPVHLRVAPHQRGVSGLPHGEIAAYVARAHAAGVAYREIAVLCASNEDCRKVHRGLARQRIASTTTSDTSIFDCAAARQLRHLMVALAAPQDASLTEALRATWFAGPGRDDPDDHGVGRLVTRLSAAFASDGVAALTRYLRSRDVLGVVAALRDAERHLTDLAHLSELVTRDCHGVTLPALVLSWLDGAATALDADEATATRRLETESDAVRVLTVHKAKGLEFDVVLLPDLVRGFREVRDTGAGAVRRWVHDARTVVDAGSGLAWGGEDATAERDRLTESADAGEQRRLLYVALTRARHSTVAWVRLRYQTPLSGELVRLLVDRDLDESGLSVVRNRPLAEVRALFVTGAWAAKGDPAVRRALRDPVAVVRENFAACPDVEVMAIGEDVPAWDPGDGVPAPAAPGGVVVDAAPHVARQRRRWSYSDVARDLAETGDVAVEDRGEVEEAAGADEARLDADERVLAREAVRADVSGVFAQLAGTRLGLVVHRVLERAVGSSGDVEDLLDEALVENGVGPGEVGDALATVRDSLHAVMGRPLETLQGRTLRDLQVGDVATEMRFVLALGAKPSPRRLSAAADAVLALDRSGPHGRGLFADYFGAPDLFAGRLSEGYLVGSLDLTVRGSDGRYRVVDYKSDQLAGAARPYAPDAMRAHMAAHHYPLQALFYAVALHRFLRDRLVDYDPSRHLGGVDYYFVRVVGDASALDGDGVASWPITPAAVAAASDALGGRHVGA